jgi:hypothetical protein
MASSSFLKGSVIAMPKKFSALNNSTIHTIALRTQHSAPDLRITLHALRITVYAQLKTLNPQRTTHNPFLRFTHYALRFQPISALMPLLPANFTHYASRFTSHASHFTPHAPQGYNLGIKVVIYKWVREKIKPKGGVNDEVASVVGHLCRRRPAVKHLINQGVGSYDTLC